MREKTETSKMKRVLFFVFTFIAFYSYKANSQTVFIDSISKQKFAVVDVHKTYERVIEKGYASLEMFEYLGNYYYKCKDFQKSKLYFDILFKKYKLSEISQKTIDLYSTL